MSQVDGSVLRAEAAAVKIPGSGGLARSWFELGQPSTQTPEGYENWNFLNDAYLNPYIILMLQGAWVEAFAM